MRFIIADVHSFSSPPLQNAIVRSSVIHLAQFFCFTFALVLSLGSAAFGDAEKKVSIYYQWMGNYGQPAGTRPFYTIRDLGELTKLWEKIHFEETVPSVDFEKCMLFVACPGPSMFDFQPMKVVGFFRKDMHYTILMDFDRRKTGGFWRNPFVIALLPKVPKGDIDVMRVGNKRKNEPTRVPLYTIWDMRRIRDTPLIAAKPYQEPSRVPPLATYGFDLTTKRNEFVVVLKAPKVVVVNANKPSTQPGFGANRPPKFIAPRPVTKPPQASQTKPIGSGTKPIGVEPKPPTNPTGETPTPPADGPASSAVDPFGDAFNLDF